VTAVTFRVDGIPAPKGSTKAMRHRTTGRVIVTETNPHTRPWAALVRDAAWQVLPRAALPLLPFPTGIAVHLGVTFILPRPVSLPKKVRAHTKKPDLDKLVRAVKDALTGVLWADDSQVVTMTAAKRYAGPDERPGAKVAVGEADAHPWVDETSKGRDT
jgi:crossover junction endodeoxyribonuclease RusA